MARRLAVLITGLDVRDRLADVRAPCLVSCRIEDGWLSPDNSRYLAEQISGGAAAWASRSRPRSVGRGDDILAAVEEFVSAIGRDRLEPALPT
jgi:hypothetical protein